MVTGYVVVLSGRVPSGNADKFASRALAESCIDAIICAEDLYVNNGRWCVAEVECEAAELKHTLYPEGVDLC